MPDRVDLRVGPSRDSRVAGAGPGAASWKARSSCSLPGTWAVVGLVQSGQRIRDLSWGETMSDMIRGDFFEEDEPLEDVQAAWDRGVKEITHDPKPWHAVLAATTFTSGQDWGESRDVVSMPAGLVVGSR